MLEQLARVLFWLACGEVVSRLGLLPVPGPVIGLVLLYLELAARGRLPDDLGALADRARCSSACCSCRPASAGSPTSTCFGPRSCRSSRP